VTINAEKKDIIYGYSIGKDASDAKTETTKVKKT
jgi:hypothetical protein